MRLNVPPNRSFTPPILYELDVTQVEYNWFEFEVFFKTCGNTKANEPTLSCMYVIYVYVSFNF